MTDIKNMDNEDLLAQINCHDPYDVEFARRYRALLAERDRYKARAERAEEALYRIQDMSYGKNAAIARNVLTQIDAEPAEPRQPAVHELFDDAWKEAQKAMRKFPQPNYVISKVAEEAGEVVKAAIHCAEGRDTPEHVTEEITQAIAMLLRLYVEGDQVHGLRALAEGDS